MRKRQREGRLARQYSFHSMLFRVSIKRLHFIIGGNFILLRGINNAFFQSISFHVDWYNNYQAPDLVKLKCLIVVNKHRQGRKGLTLAAIKHKGGLGDKLLAFAAFPGCNPDLISR